jgi:hypothetical protein
MTDCSVSETTASEMLNYGELEALSEIKQYIISTQTQHYTGTRLQTIDSVIDAGFGEGFCMGNIIKYCSRYGKKDGRNRKDLLKLIHYAIIMLYLNTSTTAE